MQIIYDERFNKNEWFIIVFLITGMMLFWKIKGSFSVKETLVYFLFNIFIGMATDHSISIIPFDFYDVNDSSAYQLMDFLTYVMYGPYGYLIYYFYDYYKIKLSYTPAYILLWSIIAISIEAFSHYIGIFHYKNGYKIYYSFPIYLLTFSLCICLFKVFHKREYDN